MDDSRVSPPTSPQSISLHLGAHKTATTWVQTRLAGSAPYLAELGVGYLPLERFRPRVTARLNTALARPAEAGPMLRQARSALARCLAGMPARFIASDENLIGYCQEIVQTGQLYPRLPERLELLGRTRLGQADRVVLTIRDYADFLPSAYGEAMRWMDFVPFDVFQQRLELDGGLWLDVIAQLHEVFGPDRLRVMRFEDLSVRLGDFLSCLCKSPVEPGRLVPSRERREGISARAMALLEEVARSDGPKRPRSLVDAAAQIFPRDAKRPAFRPWTEAESTHLQNLYAAHVRQIGARWPSLLI